MKPNFPPPPLPPRRPPVRFAISPEQLDYESRQLAAEAPPSAPAKALTGAGIERGLQIAGLMLPFRNLPERLEGEPPLLLGLLGLVVIVLSASLLIVAYSGSCPA